MNRVNKNVQKKTDMEQHDPLYHDTYKLLKTYRDTVWNLELAVQRVKNSFQIEYGNSIDEFLDTIYVAGVDLVGTQIEDYTKSIERTNKMLNLLATAVDLLRNKHKHGEQYYWILYYSFLSPQELQNTEEIIEKLQPYILNISYRTYYRKRQEAIDALSHVLWGYTAKDSIEILEQFFPEQYHDKKI